MAGIEERGADASKWKLDHVFENGEGERLTCDQSDCAIGSYVVDDDSIGTLYAPACTTCEFSAGLGDVFNSDEPRFSAGAPENFKRAAALILTHKDGSPIDAIRIGRPDTAAMIDTYAANVPGQS